MKTKSFPPAPALNFALGSLAQNQDTGSGLVAILEKRGDTFRKVTFWGWDTARWETLLKKKQPKEKLGI